MVMGFVQLLVVAGMLGARRFFYTRSGDGRQRLMTTENRAASGWQAGVRCRNIERHAASP